MGRQSTSSEADSRLANLQFENTRLRTSRAQASQRLGILLANLQQQLDDSSSTATQSQSSHAQDAA